MENLNQNLVYEHHINKNIDDSFLSNIGLNTKLSNIKTRTLDMFKRLMNTVSNK